MFSCEIQIHGESEFRKMCSFKQIQLTNLMNFFIH